MVDDEKEMRSILAAILSSMGYEVVVAQNGDEGLDLFLNKPVDVVLTDLSMPGVDG